MMFATSGNHLIFCHNKTDVCMLDATFQKCLLVQMYGQAKIWKHGAHILCIVDPQPVLHSPYVYFCRDSKACSPKLAVAY